ncbi:oligosaccharide flippase family protein [Actinobacillus porcinus]|uniref:oligosaccharide flippase family protein n=1 Tax=Actinobacillus porcinus TaxID=51048 RepID=UPI00235748AE|nr:oligosaccharide flippase family protein [Actinobacillus porcinus]
MNKHIVTKLTHLSFRLLSMYAKFLLIICIGKYLSNEALGEYSLFFSTITFAIFFLGMDFYVFNTRELINKDKKEQGRLIRDQFIFYIATYAIVFPVLLIVFPLGIIKLKYLVFFYVILIVEHLSQEVYRLFITLSRQTLATILLFLRSGAWVYIIAVLWGVGDSSYKSLNIAYIGWFIGAFISIMIALHFLRKDYGILDIREKVELQWLKHGAIVSFPFFIGTISYKVVEFSNRYIIDFFMTKSDVGIFSFYANIANALQTLVYTLVIMIYYPKLLSCYVTNDREKISLLVKDFTKETIIYSLCCSIVIALAAYPLFLMLDKIEYVQNMPMLWGLLLATFFLNLSFIPHYQLFAQKKDILIRNITVCLAAVNIFLNVLGVYFFELYGAIVATLISYFLMFICKQYFVAKK